MKALINTKEKETSIAVGAHSGWVRVTILTPEEIVLSIKPSEAILLAESLVRTAWSQKDY